MTTSRAAAASILLAMLLAGGLAACAPTAPTGPEKIDSDSSSSDDSGDDAGFSGATVSGTGDYALPADMPIGGYELPDNQDGQPDGCTWTIYVGDQVLGENNGQFVFVTDVTTRFVTDGCPDWVQFE